MALSRVELDYLKWCETNIKGLTARADSTDDTVARLRAELATLRRMLMAPIGAASFRCEARLVIPAGGRYTCSLSWGHAGMHEAPTKGGELVRWSTDPDNPERELWGR